MREVPALKLVYYFDVEIATMKGGGGVQLRGRPTVDAVSIDCIRSEQIVYHYSNIANLVIEPISSVFLYYCQ